LSIIFDQWKEPAAGGNLFFASKTFWLKLQPKLAPPKPKILVTSLAGAHAGSKGGLRVVMATSNEGLATT